MEINALIARINELAKKKKTSGLTPEDNIEVVDELPNKKKLS